MFIRLFCDHLNVLYIFDLTYIVLKSGCSSTARMSHLVVSPPSLSPSHPPTPPPRRWPALITLPPLAKFQLFWRRLCEALLSFSTLAGQKHQSLLSRLWHVGDIKVVLPWTWRLNRLLYLWTQWMRWQRRSQFEHDHRRRADRAPEIEASFTQDRRRAHWHIHIVGDAWTGPNRRQNGRESGARILAGGSPWTGQSHALVKP